ncbi:imidazolonepropionase-like amidohydrolase [Palleronia aestuarii]|uniref:Imidazolonepropionase-like amidohydrolase n=1 Tax=Palleronia aestuarii TaxID=568105 RepID=A0A2W7NJ17_9RHOB|nr:amidohydrolase family protein [Palleronia aestuarii]PZX19870.1 imidazolonepropionase-like amidohydrolase [Palleronia aestuarii]
MSAPLLFRNLRLLEPSFDEVRDGYEILVEGDRIREVSDTPIGSPSADVVDCGGRVVMPGLIDCHVHCMHSEVYMRRMEDVPLTLAAARGARRLREMLDRGFTTVRDTGGTDWGMKQAVETGLIPGPRLLIAGRSIGPTGGHSDARSRTNPDYACPCCNGQAFLRVVVDGEDEVRKAVREQMRQGCDHVKIMVSGGVASPNDPLDSMQFCVAEIDAAVEEAENFGRYVCAHAYSAPAITRAVECGVRTIEHGNLIDTDAAALMAERGAYLVANLVTYVAMAERAAEFGMPPAMLEKNAAVLEGGYRSLEICRDAGVKVAYGSDLLGPLAEEQSREFAIRAEVQPAIEVIRAATTIAAEVIRRPGRLGTIAADAWADLIVVDGNPLEDITLLEGQGRHLSAIVQGGRFHKNFLDHAA